MSKSSYQFKDENTKINIKMLRSGYQFKKVINKDKICVSGDTIIKKNFEKLCVSQSFEEASDSYKKFKLID